MHPQRHSRHPTNRPPSAKCAQWNFTLPSVLRTIPTASRREVVVSATSPQGPGVEAKYRLRALVHTTFTPGTPISNLDLLAGRDRQIDKVLETVFSPGQHAAIYGERGVGKSSLANLIYDIVFATGKRELYSGQSKLQQYGFISRNLARNLQADSNELQRRRSFDGRPGQRHSEFRRYSSYF